MKNGHSQKNWPDLGQRITLGKWGRLEKMGHTWKMNHTLENKSNC